MRKLAVWRIPRGPCRPPLNVPRNSPVCAWKRLTKLSAASPTYRESAGGELTWAAPGVAPPKTAPAVATRMATRTRGVFFIVVPFCTGVPDASCLAAAPAVSLHLGCAPVLYAWGHLGPCGPMAWGRCGGLDQA